jgi:hypothetical protein
MSVLRTAPENGPGGAAGSALGATGAGASAGRGAPSPARRYRFLVSTPEGLVIATFARKRRSRLQVSASREPGRASLVRCGALAPRGSSTANKSLKYVPALWASTGRG